VSTIRDTPLPQAGKAVGIQTIGMTMRFGGFTALDNVSVDIPAGTFHALLGENGAGKSTLVKCIMGFYHQTSGSLSVDGREVAVGSPKDAAAYGLGMVYQHFTLVPSLTGAENLVISRAVVPAVINWARERKDLAAFMERMPFKIPLDRPVSELAAGEKQKLEIVKQLYLGRSFLVLDEPTSVLTPAEADEMLGLVQGYDRARRTDGADDLAQVPRGDEICRCRFDPAPRQAGRRRARSGSFPRPKWRR
jgi:ABC-type uncharacterized transport system ATPase subunit